MASWPFGRLDDNYHFGLQVLTTSSLQLVHSVQLSNLISGSSPMYYLDEFKKLHFLSSPPQRGKGACSSSSPEECDVEQGIPGSKNQ